MRIGKPLQHVREAQKAVAIKDDVVKLCTIGKNSGLGLWLLHDSFQWVQIENLVPSFLFPIFLFSKCLYFLFIY